MHASDEERPADRSSPRTLAGWAAATLAFLVTVVLLAGELTDSRQRRWWSAHPLTTDTVAGLLVLLLTILVVNQLLKRRQARQRGRAVAGQAAILVAQARRTAAEVARAVQGSDQRDAGALELRTYMMMLLIAAPVLIESPVARRFLEQAQHAGAVMGQSLAATGQSTAATTTQLDRQEDAVQRLIRAGDPLLRQIGPEALSAIDRIGQQQRTPLRRRTE